MLSCFGAAARLSVVALVAAALTSGSALAQSAPVAAPTPAVADPVVARVNGKPILLSDVQEAAKNLPQNAQALPPQTLYPMLLDQMIDERALVAEAHRTGLDKDPAIKRQVEAAEAQALETAVLHKQIAPLVTEAAVRARYDADIAGKPGEEEVHARHILVPDEATAKKIIAELDKGADFAALSKQYSKDPGAAQQGGDLGFFKKDEMVPAFADAAFALQPGKFTQTPVHTQFGWHVIQVLERRTDPPPTFEQASQDLRQKMIQEDVQQTVAHARAGVQVEKFNLDGSAIRATDSAEPPPTK